MGTHSRVGCHRVSGGAEFFAEHGYLQIPSLVQWMATLRCGLSCRHCLAVSSEAGFGDMPLETVTALVDEVARMGVAEFLITGGEPLVREDLGEVIEYLGGRGVNWTLNTAAMPSEGLREVIARHKPGFVAVSVDGPEPVHDGFRGKAGAYNEAVEAIRFFKSLDGVRVCAGTTVTSRNYDWLGETFHLVAASGADQWGLHLLVPEGRAADRPDLFLSRIQLKRLIKFVAQKRRYFDVEMADEIGYLGYLEPLVRDAPLACGAGKAQCVVLPDGEVVPCTTLDRSCSAGNIHDQSLVSIWAEGFTGLRSWRPSGKCSHCDYSPACRGGCWLQRKAGTQCFKEVWHVPGALKTAAGVAICLGGLAAQEDAKAANPVTHAVPVVQAVSLYEAAATTPWYLDDTILSFYVNQAAGGTTYMPPDVDWNDPGWKFFKDFKEGTLPQDISERCAAVSGALGTHERSLSLIALLWRAVGEPLFEAGATNEYTDSERQILRDTLAAINQKAQAWRLEIFENNLDLYLSAGRITPRPIPHKSASPIVYVDQYYMRKDLNEERWGVAANPETREAAEAYMLAHHYAEQMDLTCTVSRGRRALATDDGNDVAGSPIELRAGSSATIGVFDVVVPVGSVRLSFEIKADIRVASGPDDESLLNDQTVEQDLSTVIEVAIPQGREYTYAELLNLVYQVHRDRLLAIAYDWLSANPVLLWDEATYAYIAVHQNGALLWPAMQEIMGSEAIIPTSGLGSASRETLPATTVSQIRRRAVIKDMDFWMF
jgi:radical SAM protein with 4Fe4S-binding SPASM domain